jgi:hypothetical protein
VMTTALADVTTTSTAIHTITTAVVTITKTGTDVQMRDTIRESHFSESNSYDSRGKN